MKCAFIVRVCCNSAFFYQPRSPLNWFPGDSCGFLGYQAKNALGRDKLVSLPVRGRIIHSLLAFGNDVFMRRERPFGHIFSGHVSGLSEVGCADSGSHDIGT